MKQGKDLLSSGIMFSGVYLTTGLERAFILPLLIRAEELGTILVSAELMVYLVNGASYQAEGVVTFGDSKYRTMIWVYLPSEHDLMMFDLCKKMKVEDFPRAGFSPPRIFLGVGNEKYKIGEIVLLHPI